MVLDLIYSVEDVFAVWLVCIVALGAAGVHVLRSFKKKWNSLYSFQACEQGGSYAVPYLAIFPLYLLLVGLILQTTIILVTKIGVMHAAHAAARTAVVWKPFTGQLGDAYVHEKVRRAAVLAIAPYASGQRQHQYLWLASPSGLGRARDAYLQAFVYAEVYKRLARNSQAASSQQNLSYVRRKYVSAFTMTDVEIANAQNRANEPLPVMVSHQLPILIPGTGRLLGRLHWSGKGYYRVIRARAMLPLETPVSQSKRIGIGYDPSML